MPPDWRSCLARRTRRLILPALAALLCACTGGSAPSWRLTDVRGHLPDLRFHLTDGNGQAVSGETYRGRLAVLYFGYTHCPDVCPLTLSHLHLVMEKLGPLASNVRILFVSVDPARDTPAVMHEYAAAFDPRVVGLTGGESEIAAVAKRYRVAFTRGPTLAGGGYEVNHSSGIYIFDARGRARLLGTPGDSVDDIVHDLRILIAMEKDS
ncbi:MAG: SCO family protein [Gammaproteobacteria bacterium]|nr:SCO family protein [Gammaproteobacteria bacterium]